MEEAENPRVTSDICGVVIIGATGIEWICIKPPHAMVYYRKHSNHKHYRGDPIFSNNPSVDAHYCVNRWPNRTKD